MFKVKVNFVSLSHAHPVASSAICLTLLNEHSANHPIEVIGGFSDGY